MAVQLVPGTIAACSEMAFDQPTIDRAVKAALDGSAPPPPMDAVDLTNVAVSLPSGANPPAVMVITATGTKVWFGSLDRPTLPPCSGQARPPG
jgi:hypothetical protein